MFGVHISNDKGNDVEDAKIFKRHLLLWQFQDVFPAEIQKFPHHREVCFSIELVPGETTTSKERYRTNTLELVELTL